LRRQAFLTKGVRIELIDYRESPTFYHGLHFEGGVLSYIQYLNDAEQILQDEPFYVEKESENVAVEVAFMYNGDIETKELSFANNIYTPDGNKMCKIMTPRTITVHGVNSVFLYPAESLPTPNSRGLASGLNENSVLYIINIATRAASTPSL
jgi:DNA gyrase/topoisomerase IV subunit B